MAADIALETADNRRTAAWLACATLIALAAAMRLWDLSAYGLESDEVFSVIAARSSWHQMFSIVIDDKSHPPLHYILLKLALGLGAKAEIAARLPSVLAGVGLMPIAWSLCRQLRVTPRDTLLVLFLVATNGTLIYFAQYARMFAPLEFFAALSLWLFLRLWRGFSWRTWGLLTAVNILMVYTHYWGVMLVAAQCILVLLWRRKTAARMILSAGLTALAFLPWLVLVGQAAARQGNLASQISWMGSGVPGLIDYLWLIAALNGFVAFPYATRLGLVLFAAPVVAACVILALQRRAATLSEMETPGFWMVLVATPLLLTSLASFVAGQNLWGERHLTIVALPYYILLGLSLSRLDAHRWTNALRAAILLWAVAAAATYLARDDKRYHWDTLAAEIAARPPAPVYGSEWFVRVPLAYYLESTPAITVTEQRDLGKIDADRFWYVYRDVTWTGPDPAAQFAARGYVIAARTTMRWWQQTATALLVEKPPR